MKNLFLSFILLMFLIGCNDSSVVDLRTKYNSIRFIDSANSENLAGYKIEISYVFDDLDTTLQNTFQIKPNPFTYSTLFSFDVPVVTNVRIEFLDKYTNDIYYFVNNLNLVQGNHSISFEVNDTVNFKHGLYRSNLFFDDKITDSLNFIYYDSIINPEVLTENRYKIIDTTSDAFGVVKFNSKYYAWIGEKFIRTNEISDKLNNWKVSDKFKVKVFNPSDSLISELLLRSDEIKSGKVIRINTKK